MIALELVTDRQTKAPAREVTQALLAAALQRGLLLLSSGTYGNVIRTLVPLTISDEILDEGLDVLEQALEAVAS